MAPHRPAIASMSLGRAFAGHRMDHKLACAAKAGLAGVEIFYEDLEYLAKEQEGASEDSPSEEQLLAAARLIQEMCQKNKLKIIGLQPFLFYEGLVDRKEHAQMIEKLQTWLKIAKLLGTDVIQIPTQFRRDEGVTGDSEVIVRDMVEVADLGLKENPPIKFAYENLAWGTFIDRWERLWDVVRRVDRWNFGMCLDTFHLVGRVWADPGAKDGTNGRNSDRDLKKSLSALVETVDVQKVWYIQVAGAERLSSPLVEGHDWYVEGQPARMSWSRNARLFYGEEDRGQYLPIDKAARALLDPVDKGGLGFEGWVSMELFSRTMNDESKTVPDEHARRGGESWKKLSRDLSLVQ
jgi:4-hydroxyphenylpyruvate dioxygenase